MMGCTWNNKKALRKIVTGKRIRLTVNRLYHEITGKIMVTAALAEQST
jgi:hypothetical protein